MFRNIFFSLLFFLCCTQVHAQLCTGSLGDPLVNITFGAGANPGQPLAAAATGYQYVTGDCPSDGFYTVRSNTTNCFGTSWHNLGSDHTGDANGYFMLVNASIQPAAFYVDTVRGLCANSTFEFAAWVMNVLLPTPCGGNGIQPNLTFTIERTDGTVLQTYNSGNIPSTSSPQWKQYGFFFTTPAGGSDIVLRIVNNAPGGCGNDLALDDITFRPCGPLLTPTITGIPGTTANVCEGTAASIALNCVVSGGYVSPVFQWQQRFNGGAWTNVPLAGQPSVTVSVPANAVVGVYEYRLSVAEAGNFSNPQCRVYSDPLTIRVNALPVAVAGNNGPLCEGDTLKLNASGGNQYAWTGPGPFLAATATPEVPAVTVALQGIYRVSVTNAAGCSTQTSTTVVINNSPVASVAFADTAICVNDSITLSASGGGSYSWSPATGLSTTTIAAPKASPAVPTLYTVTVTNAAGCRDTARVNIRNVYAAAVANAGPDKILVLGASIRLDGSIQGDYQSFFWSPSPDIVNPAQLQPTVKPTGNAFYILNAVSQNSCGSSTDTVFIKTYTGIFIPTAFSPNGDGVNDTWVVPALEAYPDFELKLFNRYGQAVFINSGTAAPWDGRYRGKALPAGAYAYVIRLSKSLPPLKGTVLIVR